MVNLKKILPRNVRGKLMDSLWFLPDKLYIQLFYYAVTGKFPDLEHPQGFNEKLNWLKLHGDYSQYTDYSDKIKVREIIKEKLGDGYMFPLLGQWKKFDDIDFDKLPEQFVLKCNHDSGSVKLIRSKSALTVQDKNELKKFFDARMKYDFFIAGREPCYKGIDRYIIAEQMMGDINKDKGGINDYKFHCFNGEPKLMFTVSGRQTQKHEDYFDMDYHWYQIENGSTSSAKMPPKPACFDEMVAIVRKVCAGIKYVRIDMYEIDGKIYFGEYTFFSGGGFELFKPEEWERKLGDWLVL